MRGNTSNAVGGASMFAEEPVSIVAAATEQKSNIEKNMEPANKPGSIVWLLVILGVYLLWDYIQNKSSLSDSLDAANVRANVHNLMVIGFASVIFINLMNVLLTKLAALEIPLLSKTAGAMLPLFHL